MEQETNTDTNTEEGTNADTGDTSTEETKVDTVTKVDETTKEDNTTEDKVDTKKDIMIPKHRFDEVNENFKDLKRQLDEMKASRDAEKEAPEKEKKEDKQEDAVNPKIEALEKQVNEFNNVMKDMVTQKTESIPEDMRDLIPDGLTEQQKLNWITKAEQKGLFKKQSNAVVGQPLNHSSEQDKSDAMKKMNPVQLFASYYGNK